MFESVVGSFLRAFFEDFERIEISLLDGRIEIKDLQLFESAVAGRVVILLGAQLTVEISDIFAVFSSLDIDRLLNSKFFSFVRNWWSWICNLQITIKNVHIRHRSLVLQVKRILFNEFKEFQLFKVSVCCDRSDLCPCDQFKRLNSRRDAKSTEVLSVNEICLNELDECEDEFYDALEFPAIDLSSRMPNKRIEIKIGGMRLFDRTREFVDFNCANGHSTSAIYNLNCQLTLDTNISSTSFVQNSEIIIRSFSDNEDKILIIQLLDICVQFSAANQRLCCLEIVNVNLEVDDEIKIAINSAELKDSEKKQLMALNELIVKIGRTLQFELHNTTISCDLSALKQDPTDEFVFLNTLICQLSGNITFDGKQLKMSSDLNIEEIFIGQSNSILDQTSQLYCTVQLNEPTYELAFGCNSVSLHLPLELLKEFLRITFRLIIFLKNLLNIDQVVSQISEINLVIENNQTNFVKVAISELRSTGTEIEADCLVDLFNAQVGDWEPLIEKFGVSVSIDWNGKIEIESAVNQPINLTLTSWYIEEIYELSGQSSFSFPKIDVDLRSSIGISIVDETREELVYVHLKDLRLGTKYDDRNLQMSITMASIQCLRLKLSNLWIHVDERLLWQLASFLVKLPGVCLEHSIWSFDHLELTFGSISVSVVTVQTNSLPEKLKKLKQAIGFPLISFEDAAIRLPTFRVLKFVGSLNQLANTIAKLYYCEIQKQMLSIAGSMDMLGSPIALASDLNHGLSGLQNLDVSGFVFDVTHGLTNSIAKFSASMSHGVGQLVFDEKHKKQREVVRKETSIYELYGSLRSFGRGIIGGLTSLANSTLNGQENGWTGVLRGAATGASDSVTKPVQGLLDLVGGTASVLRSLTADSKTQFSKFPTQQRRLSRVCFGLNQTLSSYNETAAEAQQTFLRLILKDGGERFLDHLIIFSGTIDNRPVQHQVMFCSCNLYVLHKLGNSQEIVQRCGVGEILECRLNSWNKIQKVAVELRTTGKSTVLIWCDGKKTAKKLVKMIYEFIEK
ncbi:Vacuolar protein sorting-associated protein 13D [Aphelenchoides besseyi]|nr:Vacuolar protein sorting-associated protein 13D [Aphelenchoides besseyi]